MQLSHAEEAQDILDMALVGTRPALRPISILVSRKVKETEKIDEEQVTRNVQQVRAKIHMSTRKWLRQPRPQISQRVRPSRKGPCRLPFHSEFVFEQLQLLARQLNVNYLPERSV